MKLMILSALVLMTSCATVGPLAADILKTCVTPAAEAEAGQLYQTVLAIVEKQPVNWKDQLAALESNFKTGVLCALQEIANSQSLAAFSPGAMARFAPSPLAVTNAKLYLAGK